jgi:hypothetical protein
MYKFYALYRNALSRIKVIKYLNYNQVGQNVFNFRRVRKLLISFIMLFENSSIVAIKYVLVKERS